MRIRRLTTVLIALLIGALTIGLGATPASADSSPGVDVGDVTMARSTTGVTNFVFPVTLEYASNNTVTVEYSTSDGSAHSPHDYTGTEGSLSFAPGTVAKTVTVAVQGNPLHTGNLYFYLNLSAPLNATVNHGSGTGTIIDPTLAPYLNVGDATAVEGAGTAATATFTATLSTASANPVTFRYSTSDGSARAGFDYTATSGTVTMAPGQVTASLTVPILATSVYSASKYFYMNTSTATNATLGTDQGVGTILNSNHTAWVTVDDTAATASTTSTGTVNFPVRLLSPSTFPVTVDYSTSDGSATSAAGNYAPVAGTVTFAPGTTLQTVPVTIGSELSTASTKYFDLNLANPSAGASLARSTGYGTIGGPTAGYTQLAVGDVGLVRAHSGTSALTFTVTLTPAATSTVTVHYATSDNTATAPGDYTATSGTLTFTAGQTSQTASVTVVGNTTTFADKDFYMNLSSATGGATIDRSSAYGMISNGNVEPVLSVDSLAVVKPASGTVTAAFTVHLSQTSPNPVTATAQTSDGSATAAGANYSPFTGTVTIPAGQTSATVDVSVNGNTTVGSTLYFYLNLSAPTDAVLAGNNSAVGYIENPNHSPTLSVNNVAVYAPLTGTATSNFTVTLSSASTQTVTVNYATSDGSATVANGDYTATSGTLSFAPGTLTKTVPVTIKSTTVAHASRYFYLSISTASNATIVSSSGTDTILDDAVEPYVSVNSPSVPAGSTSTTLDYTVSLTSPTVNSVTVHYATSDGSAVAGAQYTAVSGTLTFAAGVVSQTVPVTVLPDTVKAADRYFYLNLTAPTNAIVASPGYGVGEILNTAVNPGLSVGDVTIDRPTSTTATAVFTITLAPASPNTVTVNYATANGSAVAPTDFTAVSGSATFAPGTTTQTVSVTIQPKSTSTSDLYYYLDLTAPVNAQLQRSYAIGYLVDQVAPVVGKSYVTVSDAVAVDSASATTTEAFTVSLALASTTPVYVRYYTSDSSAVAGIDYTATRGTLAFTPGQTKKTVDVTVAAQPLASADKAFYLNLQQMIGSDTIERGSGYGYILDPNPTTTASIVGPTSVIKGDSGTTNAVFTVALDAPQTTSVQVDYYTSDGSATAAGGDYQSTYGTLVFAPGVTSQTVTVVVNSNTEIRSTEYYYLNLQNPVGVVLPVTSEVGYILDPDVFTVSGSVVNSSGTGVAGVTITRTGNDQPTETATSSSTGAYTLPNTLNGKYTLTASMTGTTFLPATVTVTVRGAGITAGVFLAYSGVAITGQTMTSTGTADAGVTITRTGGGQATATAVSDTLGYYALGSLPNGTNYVVTPTKTGQVAVPTSYTVSITGTTVANQTFVMVTAPYISGRVTASGVGVAGVTVTLTGGTQPSTKVTTNVQGYYGFSAVSASAGGTTYTVTPTLTGHTFTPAALNETVSTTANASGVNFTEN